MPSGGARTRSGPPPDPHALRRDRKSDQAGWTTLPAEGRAGDAPAWPLPKHPIEEMAEREADLWWDLWHRPQALLWERDHQAYIVAMYVRASVEAELPGAVAASRAEVRRQANALLLTGDAMRAARVRIATDEVGERRESTARAAAVTAPSSRSRLRAVKGGGKRGRG
jgi:hypothetical protein